MQLFAVNRYDAERHDPNKSHEEEKLAKLLKKVEKRKRKLEKENKRDVQAADEEDDDDKPGKQSRQNEDESAQEESPAIQTSEQEANEEQSPPPPPSDRQVEFQVLGDDAFDKKSEAKMVLPPWLRHPTIILNEISTNSADLDEFAPLLSPTLLLNLKLKKITKLFPVQKEVIPWILEAHSKPAPFRPRDICVSAATGSGKTLAFALPIVQLLMNRVECKVRALVILPAAELAQQVFNVFRTLVRKTDLKVGLLTIATPFETEQKNLVDKFQGKFYSKLDIVISTPGRLVEHLHSTEGFDLKSLRFLVIDEADRMMEQSHHNWLYHLDEHIKTTSESFMAGQSVPLCLHQLENQAMKQPYKMLFSATLTQDPEKLQNLRLFQPKLFTSIVKSPEEFVSQLLANASQKQANVEDMQGDFIGKYTTPAELSEFYAVTTPQLKPLTLFSLIKEQNWKRFLCFTNTIKAANRLSFVLDNMLKNNRIQDLSSALKPGERKTVLANFARGKIQGIVCSDALARGIDIENVDVVISYELPRHINTYIHRVGRTARAGKKGIAVTILTDGELNKFNKILQQGDKDPLPELKVKPDTEEKFAQEYSSALQALQAQIKQEEKHKQRAKKYTTKMRESSSGNLSIMNRLQEKIEENISNSKAASQIPMKLVAKEKIFNRKKNRGQMK